MNISVMPDIRAIASVLHFGSMRAMALFPGYGLTLALLLFTGILRAVEPGISIDVDLTQQKAFMLLDGKIIYEAAISSGRPGHVTPTGDFTVLEKDPKHFSSLYGKIVDADGKVLDWNADTDMPVPKGAKFIAAPMEYFLRFDGATGLHAGIIPGYAASHGCVRLPKGKAILFFNTSVIGTPVHIHGTAPKVEPPPPRVRPTTPASSQPAGTPDDHRVKWFPFIKRLHD